MTQIFLIADTWLFHFLNSYISNPVFDFIMPFITNSKNWIPVYILMFVIIFLRTGKKGILISLVLLLSVGIANEISSHVIKEWIGRPRPCHVLSDLILRVSCGPGKSMPSSHATNNFAMATVLTFYFPRWKWLFFSLAGAVAFSRVYIGVHYPGDIIAGAIIGWLIALILLKIVTFSTNKFRNIKNRKDKEN